MASTKTIGIQERRLLDERYHRWTQNQLAEIVALRERVIKAETENSVKQHPVLGSARSVANKIQKLLDQLKDLGANYEFHNHYAQYSHAYSTEQVGQGHWGTIHIGGAQIEQEIRKELEQLHREDPRKEALQHAYQEFSAKLFTTDDREEIISLLHPDFLATL